MRFAASGLVRCLLGWMGTKNEKISMKNNTNISWNPYTLLKSYIPKRTVVFQPPSFQGYVKLRGRNPFMASKRCYVFVRFCKPHSWHAPETGPADSSQLLDGHHFTQNSSQERSRCYLLAYVFDPAAVPRSLKCRWIRLVNSFWFRLKRLVWCPGAIHQSIATNQFKIFAWSVATMWTYPNFSNEAQPREQMLQSLSHKTKTDWLIDLWWFARLCYPLIIGPIMGQFGNSSFNKQCLLPILIDLDPELM